MTGWRRLRETLRSVENWGEEGEGRKKSYDEGETKTDEGAETRTGVEKYKEKGKKKGVTWADEADGGCLEKTRVVSFEGPPPLLVVPGRERRVCGETLGCEVGDKERVKVECVGLDRDEDVVMGDVKDVDEASEDVMPSNASEDSPYDLPPSFSPPPSISPPPYSPACPPSSSSSSPTPSPVEVEDETSHHQQHSTIRDGHDLDLRTDTDIHIPGWDSDLSNLSESDSSSSETDSATDSDSTDESDLDTTGTSASTIPVTVTVCLLSPLPPLIFLINSLFPQQPPQPSIKTGLKIRIRIPPTRPATPIRLCASGDCSESLEGGDGYKWKVCVLCRARKRARRRLKALVVVLEEELRCARRYEKKGSVNAVDIEVRPRFAVTLLFKH